ncbi:MAG: hypothetical protein IJZ36_04175 [Bacilli bacterium]|nr:hypothetical protein [Bacilli bacterium]
MSKIYERFLMDMTEPKESKELFLRIVGTDESDISKIIGRYEEKSMSLMNMFIKELEKEAKEIPQVPKIEPIIKNDYLERRKELVLLPEEELLTVFEHQLDTNNYIKYWLKVHKPSGYENCERQLDHRNKEIQEFINNWYIGK